MVSMAIMVASFRQSLDDWLVRVLPADVYVRAAAAGDSALLTPDEQRRIASLAPGSRASRSCARKACCIDPARPRVALLARDLPARDPGAALPLVGDAYASRDGDPPPVWISEARGGLSRHGAPGDARRRSRLRAARATFVVAGVWRDYARQQGALVIDRATYIALTGDDGRDRCGGLARAGHHGGRSFATRSTPRFRTRRGSRSRRPARSARSRCASSIARSR